MITWEQSSLKCIREDTHLSEPLEGEEGAAVAFPLSREWWASNFNLLHGRTALASGQGKIGQCGFNRWKNRQGQIGTATMFGDCWVENLLPSIIFQDLGLQ
jgi:hypothetical protein